jgi:hypothetical protein
MNNKQVMHKQSKDLLRRKKEKGSMKNIKKRLHHLENSEFKININHQKKDLERKKDSKHKHHSEDIPTPSIKLIFLVYVIHLTIMGTKL